MGSRDKSLVMNDSAGRTGREYCFTGNGINELNHLGQIAGGILGTFHQGTKTRTPSEQDAWVSRW